MKNSRTIPISRGQLVIVDAENYDFLMQWKWYCSNTGYATRDVVHSHKNPRIVEKIGMHRVILNCPEGKIVDHINQNRLDNRKQNIRICTRAQNVMNSSKRKNKKLSKYKGVFFKDRRRKKYVAIIGVNKKRIHLGSFVNEKDAALAYNNGAVQYHGEFAKLNEIFD